MIDFSLTDAQRDVQRTARAFAEREILPRIRELDEVGRRTTDRCTRRWAPRAYWACRSPSNTGARNRLCRLALRARSWSTPILFSG